MNQEPEKKEEKKLKTWDEAINELQAFIIKSKKEEKEQQEQQEKEQQS